MLNDGKDCKFVNLAALHSTIAACQQSAIDQAAARYELESVLEKLRQFHSEQLCLAQHSGQAAESELVRTRQRLLADVEQLRSTNQVLENELRQREPRQAAQLAKARQAQRAAEQQLAAAVDQHTKIAEQLKARLAKAEQLGSAADAELAKTKQKFAAEREQLRKEHQAASSERESAFAEQLATAQGAQVSAEGQLASAVEQHAKITAELQAQVAELQKIVSGRDAELRELENRLVAQEDEFINLAARAQQVVTAAEAKLAQSSRQHAAEVQQLRTTTRALEQEWRQQSLKMLPASAIHQQQPTEPSAMQAGESVEKLQEQISALQLRLQREAAGRRKAEGALMRENDATPGVSTNLAIRKLLKAQQRVERLTAELEATRNVRLAEQRQANIRLRRAQDEAERLRSELSSLQKSSPCTEELAAPSADRYQRKAS